MRIKVIYVAEIVLRYASMLEKGVTVEDVLKVKKIERGEELRRVVELAMHLTGKAITGTKEF